MTCYSVEPTTKKNVVETETWYNDAKNLYLEIEQLWRWGRYIINLQEGETIPKEGPFYPYEYEDCELDFHDDGISMDFSVRPSDMSVTLSDEEYDRIIEELWEIWDSDTYMGLEEAGWVHEDTEVAIYGELEVTECE